MQPALHQPAAPRPRARRAALPVLLALMFLAVAVPGCSATKTAGDQPTQAVIDRLEGLMLLDGVLSKQTDLDKVTVIKTVRPEVKPILTAITKASEQGSKTVRQILGSATPKGYEPAEGLPAMEEAAREGIEAVTTRQIIFSSGNSLEFQLLYNQLQSSRYISQLALALSNKSEGQDREKLRAISDEFNKFYDQIYGLMLKAYKP